MEKHIRAAKTMISKLFSLFFWDTEIDVTYATVGWNGFSS